MIKIIIADDMIIFRDSLKYLLENQECIEVVACADNGEEAFKLCKKHKPDIVLMDIVMPVCDGILGTKLIKDSFPMIKVLVLTTLDDEEKVRKAISCGADSYVLKDTTPFELVNIIKSLYNGYTIIQKNVFDSVIRDNSIFDKNTPENANLCSKLTARELTAIKLVVDGKSYKEIAGELYITEGSARNLIVHILTKLNLTDRIQLAVFAVRNKLA
ncbi:MAG TPA: response regulator transcription factor [Pseudobacteroides sp.]|uniref:response regulator transcription factor n=1 Tax=Pseudobacteroides sp. TaxID=1968840 RepID=UPI002F92C5C8